MRITKVDRDKFEQLKEALEEFVSLHDELQFEHRYLSKFKNILMSSASKLVGCDEKLLLNPREPNKSRYDYTEYVLTREGIKETFGYDGTFKSRIIAGDHWIINYVKKNTVTVALVKLLKSAKVKNKDGLKLHLQAMQDLSSLQLDNEIYQAHIKDTVPYVFYGDVEKQEENDITTTKELLLSIRNAWADKPLIFAKEGSIYEQKHWGGNYLDGDILFHLQRDVPFTYYIRISEEPTYSRIIALLKAHTIQVKAHITKKNSEIEEIIAKYGQYLVYTEL